MSDEEEVTEFARAFLKTPHADEDLRKLINTWAERKVAYYHDAYDIAQQCEKRARNRADKLSEGMKEIWQMHSCACSKIAQRYYEEGQK